MFVALKNYLSLIKFSHTVFALPFAMIGFFLSVRDGAFEFKPLVLVYVVLCMIFARSAAMGFNRYIDRKFDAMNPRTKMREVPAGVISANAALFFVIIMSLLFMATTWFINPLCFYLSPVALLVVLGYSYTKRFTALCHLVLGVGLGLAPIGSYLAVTGHFSLLPLLFSFTVFFWVSGFDIIYALQDEEFDVSQNLKSIPGYLGKKRALRLSELLHLFSTAFVVWAGIYGHFGFIYWIGVAFFCGLLIYQHSIVKPNDLSRVNLAFGTTNGIASVVFACFTLADMFIK
ncbi:MAG: putative 4-hydroxybenzoate polyprenyltransferase [Bacteroidetes bacterium]|jgi:4-hydroxybenzoate polyprenyltransferase|nr:putative 4-hydroxybenzoate polyprenyltransferase [Bacteroidota bacterium]